MNREEILDKLLGTNEPQLEIFRARHNVPKHILPKQHAERAIAILEWFEQQGKDIPWIEAAVTEISSPKPTISKTESIQTPKNIREFVQIFGWIILLFIIGGIIVWWLGAFSKLSTPLDESKDRASNQQQNNSPKVWETTPKLSYNPNLLPAPLSKDEYNERFWSGDLARAERANQAGFSKRKKHKDNAAAAQFYRDAINYDPSFPWPYWNLACELALDGRPDEAIEKLEAVYLMSMNEDNPLASEARSALLRSEADKDLQSIWDHPRLLAIVQKTASHTPMVLDHLKSRNCRGWSDNVVVCSTHCGFGKKNVTGITVVAYHVRDHRIRTADISIKPERKYNPLTETVPDLTPHHIPLRDIYRTTLSRGQSTAVGHYEVTWAPNGDTNAFVIKGPLGTTTATAENLIFTGGCPPGKQQAPNRVYVYVLPSLNLVILYGEFVETDTSRPVAVATGRGWSSVAFVRPGDSL